jgi:hypothetical protein
MLSVPALALAGSWPVAAGLMIGERASVEEFDALRCRQFCLALAETWAVDASSE